MIAWMCGEEKQGTYGAGGLGWTYRGELAMAAYNRPLEDPLVEELLVPNVFCVAADEDEFRYGTVLFHEAGKVILPRPQTARVSASPAPSSDPLLT